jgi:hypothetical protein
MPDQAGIPRALAMTARLRRDQDQVPGIVPDWHPEAGQIREALAALPSAEAPR